MHNKEKTKKEEAKEMLGITDENFKQVKSNYKYSQTSLDAKVNDDEDSLELSNFVSTGEIEIPAAIFYEYNALLKRKY